MGARRKSGLNYYAAGTLFTEDGWRKFSPSKVRQGFVKLGQRWQKGYISLGFSYADNYLAGNGVQDGRWLALDYTSVYTVTDANWNRSPALTLNSAHQVSRTLTLSGNAYFRYVRSDSINPNLNGNSFDESLYQPSAGDIAALKAAGYTGYPTSGANASNTPFPFWRCIGEALSFNEPIEKCDATITRGGWTHEHNYGFSGQALWKTRGNSFIPGASWDGSGVTFQQSTQFGYLNPDRISITSVPFFADGTSNSNGTPVDSRVNLHGTVNTRVSIWRTPCRSEGGRSPLRAATTMNTCRISTAYRGRSSAPTAATAAAVLVNGDYIFQRFNPSRLTFNTGKVANLYSELFEANRAPTTIELGCADPNYPCNLPNALAGDPPLKQVVTRTFEGGARSATEGKLRWNADYFFSQNYDDLLFVSADTTGLGYFTNFGKTRRDGLEFSVSETFSKWHIGGNYTFQNVTYQSPQSIDGGANSSADGGPGLGGNISILPGHSFPRVRAISARHFSISSRTRRPSSV